MDMTISELQKEVHKTAVEKGWWEGPPRNLFEQAALFHSEISEYVEDLRKGHPPYNMWLTDKGKPEGPAIELADLLIRVFDTAEAYGVDLEAALQIKMEYNRTRPYRHGGKIA